MKWFQVDADTPNDPKIRVVIRDLGIEGLGGLFLLWCHVADHGIRRPGWSIDSFGRPMPVHDLIDASGLAEAKFHQLVLICTEVGHFLKQPWVSRKVIAIPAMARRADTYTKRRVRTNVEQPSKSVRTKFVHKTVQDKTTHTNKERTRLAPHGTPATNGKVIRRLIQDVLKVSPSAGFTDLKELAKQACVDQHLAYDAAVVGSALEQALARKSRAS